MIDEVMFTAFRTYLVTERRFALNSVAAYTADVEQFLNFLEKHDLDLSEYTKDMVLEFLATLHNKNLSSATVGRKVVSLRLFGSFLADQYNLNNEMEHISPPKPEQLLPKYLTEDEINQLLSYLKEEASSDRGLRNYLMIVLLYSGGLRISELLSLTTASFRFDTGFVEIVGKRGTHRAVPIPAEILDLTKKYIASHVEGSWIFESSHSGNPLSRQQCWNIVKDVVQKSGVMRDISPHSLRHSLATHFLGRGMDLRSLQVFLGHESIETVQVYTHVDRTALHEAYKKAHPRK